MDRLTISGFDYDRDFIASHLQSWSIAQAVKRLAAYEDTGLTPDEIVTLKADRDRWKERAEAAERDINRMLRSDETEDFCVFCKCFKDKFCACSTGAEWRGPQEGANT